LLYAGLAAVVVTLIGSIVRETTVMPALDAPDDTLAKA